MGIPFEQRNFQKELDKVGVADTHAYERYFFILHIFKKDLGFRSHIQKVLHIKIVTHNILYYCFPKMAIDFIYKFLYMEIYGLIHILAGKASQCRKIYNLLLKYFMPIFLLTVENDGKI